ncbi:M16 family metallopeptidase [Kitasatospora sp. NBC_01539]|uniref:M16 family metallopeptidase n=1 Tax=Kitasatospora sp. NBC_01539 TaxID=2903577 RepID=UPI0038602B7A
MNREVIDGVPVLWAEAPGPLEAVLMVGCGVRDETLRTAGVTHLVEHLAMSTLPRLHHEHNASVDLATTQFTCSGRPEQVTAFLAAVCEALADLPLDRIDREAGVLAAEEGRVADPVTAELLSGRYGVQGPGLAAYTGPGADRIPVEAVRDTVSRHFHRGNAVLLLTGPPPAGLRLPLPDGVRPDRTAAPEVLLPGPAWWQEDLPGLGLTLRGDLDDPALLLAFTVLSERLRRTVRHEHGLSYDVGGDNVFTGPGSGERTVCLDARDGQEQRVAELLWQEVLKVARDGVTDAELADEVEGLREALLDPRAVLGGLGEAAGALLFDDVFQEAEPRLAALGETTPEEVRAAFAAALETVLVVVPCGVELDVRLPDGRPLPKHSCIVGRELPAGAQVFRPSLTDRLLSSAARRVRLGVDAHGVWLRGPDGEVHGVPFAEVVGVEMRGPGRVVFGRSTCSVPVLPDFFAGIGPAVAAIDAAVPAALRYPASAFRPAD